MTRLHVLRLPTSHLNGALLRSWLELESHWNGTGWVPNNLCGLAAKIPCLLVEELSKAQKYRKLGKIWFLPLESCSFYKCPWNMLTQIPGLRRQVSVVWFNYCCNPPCDYPGGFGMVCRSKLYGGGVFSQLPCFRTSHVPSENGTCMYVLVMKGVSPKSMVYGKSWKTLSVQHV